LKRQATTALSSHNSTSFSLLQHSTDPAQLTKCAGRVSLVPRLQPPTFS
jgi:hypothetical protein